jgi:hypothetical protein
MEQSNRALKVFSGLAAVTAMLLGAATYDRWWPASTQDQNPAPEVVAVTVVPDQQQSEAPAQQPAAETAAPPQENAPAPPPATADQLPATPEVPAAAEETARAPQFDTVRVEPSGEAIMAGTAEPGSEVTVKLNGEVVGRGVANADGAWVVVPEKPLAPGTGELSVEQKAPGTTGVTASEQTVAVAVPEPQSGGQPMVALLEPDAPTKVLQTPGTETVVGKTEPPAAVAPEAAAAPDAAAPGVAAEPPAAIEPSAPQPAPAPAPAVAPLPGMKVALDSVDYNDRGDIVFSGRAGAGSNVRIYVDNRRVGDALSGADGIWSWTGRTEIAPGGHALRIDQIDAAGKVIGRIELPFMREEPERVVALAQPKPAETAPAVAPPPAPPAQVAAIEPQPPHNGKIVIQPGNNLWKLSRVIYGRGKHYTVIYQANRDQIRNPNLIYPGQIFTTPDASPPEQIDPRRKQPLTPEEGGAPLD